MQRPQTNQVSTVTLLANRALRSSNVIIKSDSSHLTALYRRFFANNLHLLKKNGQTFHFQAKQLKKLKNVNVHYNTVQRLIRGEVTYATFHYLDNFAQYWGVPLEDMLSRDFAAEEQQQQP